MVKPMALLVSNVKQTRRAVSIQLNRVMAILILIAQDRDCGAPC